MILLEFVVNVSANLLINFHIHEHLAYKKKCSRTKQTLYLIMYSGFFGGARGGKPADISGRPVQKEMSGFIASVSDTLK